MSALPHETPAPIPPPNTLLDAALAYAAQGFKVFPCKPRGKEPLTRNGYKAATTDAATIRKWWAKWPEANIGLATAGLLVVDTDGPEGEAAIAGSDLPRCPTAHTGKGTHRFLMDTAGTARNKAGVLPQVDIRAAGGFVIAAPSVHPSGAVYTWAPGLSPDDLTPPPAPQWLYDLAAPRGDIPPPAPPEEAPPTIPQGKRNDELTRLAGGLRADGAELAAITAELLAANKARCKPPLPEGEVKSVAASVMRYPAGPSGPTVRVAKRLLRAGLTDGALALYAARQALVQDTGAHPKQQAQAQALGVGLRSVKQWAAELRAAGMDRYERPSRSYVTAPAGLLTDPQVPHEAKVTALHLLACTNTDGAAAVGLAALAKSRGLCPRSVRYHLDELRERGHLLRQVAPFNPELGRRERCNTYRFAATAAPVAVGLTPQKVQQVAHRTAAAGAKVQQVAHESKPLGRKKAVAVSPHAPQAHSQRVFPTKATPLQSAPVEIAAPPAPLAARLQAAKVHTEPPPPDAAQADADLQAQAQALAVVAGLHKAAQVVALVDLIRRHGLAVAAETVGCRNAA